MRRGRQHKQKNRRTLFRSLKFLPLETRRNSTLVALLWRPIKGGSGTSGLGEMIPMSRISHDFENSEFRNKTVNIFF